MLAARLIGNPRPLVVSAFLPLTVLAYLSISPAPIHAFNDLWCAASLDELLPLFWVWPLAHLTSYATLTLLLSRFRRLRRQGLWFALAMVGLGLGFEIVQEMTGERTFETVDLIANTCGVALAFIVLDIRRWRADFRR